MQNVGAILFDDNHIQGTDSQIVAIDGMWVSRNGTAARRLTSIHDLPNDTIWFTNLNYKQMTATRLHAHPNFKGSDWLRIPMAVIMDEYGLNADSMTPNTSAEMLAMFAYRIVNTLSNEFGLQGIGRKSRLVEDIVEAFKLPKPILPDLIYSAFEGISTHYNVATIHNMSFSSSMKRLRTTRNRLIHAREMLSLPLPPDTGWETDTQVAKDFSDDWLDKVTNPFLVKVRIHSMNPIMAETLSFGSGGNVIREWITDVEWREVRKYAQVDVLAAIHCRQESAVSPLLDKLPKGQFAQLSPTYCIIAEHFWLAHCQLRVVRTIKRHPAAAAYLRSMDRMVLFREAIKLHSRGLTIHQYGVGAMSVNYADNDLGRTISLCCEYGLLPSRAKINELAALNMQRASTSKKEEIAPGQEQGIFMIDLLLRSRADHRTLRELDGIIIDTKTTDLEKHEKIAAIITTLTQD